MSPLTSAMIGSGTTRSGKKRSPGDSGFKGLGSEVAIHIAIGARQALVTRATI
jgi:hypothetical protein